MSGEITTLLDVVMEMTDTVQVLQDHDVSVAVEASYFQEMKVSVSVGALRATYEGTCPECIAFLEGIVEGQKFAEAFR